MCHSLHLCKVLLNTSDESSKIPSVTTTVTIWLRTEQFTLCYVTDVLTTLPIITLDTEEAGVIYWSKLGSAWTSQKFWGMVDTYMESLYTKFQVNRSKGSSWSLVQFNHDFTM